MANNKKPARKGGAKKAAPKKSEKRVPKLTERQADQLAADKMRADSFASTQPKRPTVEEQFSYQERLRMDAANGLARRVAREFEAARKSAKQPSLWSRFRSAITGLFVSKKYAEANPDTTVRERVKP